jgi:aminopeptidase N
MCKMHGSGPEGGGMDITHGRQILPANVIPRHYDLTLEPDFEKLTYEGKVIIDLDVAENSTSISLNTLELDIHSTKVILDSKTIRLVLRTMSDQRSNHLIVRSIALLPIYRTMKIPKPPKLHLRMSSPKGLRHSSRWFLPAS